jgi:RNA polymerase sigma-70 factor (ECF subfamily)
MDETVLIQAAQAGDLAAFNGLVLAYQADAFNLAARVLGDSAAAEDVTQGVFLRLYQRIGTFRGGSFRAWVLHSVVNGCLDEIRRAGRHPTVPLEPVNQEDEEVEDAPWMADEENNPERLTLRREQVRAIEGCIGALPVPFRLVVLLVDVQGLDYQSAAEVLGCPVGTVKSRLARARLQLRGCLAANLELSPDERRLHGK